jgi:hypothetical protein
MKDKWINIRCTEEQRQEVTELAKQCNMAVSELFWHLVAKEVTGIPETICRCKDCKHSNEDGTICRYSVGRPVEPEHFCSYGTPRNDEVRE